MIIHQIKFIKASDIVSFKGLCLLDCLSSFLLICDTFVALLFLMWEKTYESKAIWNCHNFGEIIYPSLRWLSNAKIYIYFFWKCIMTTSIGVTCMVAMKCSIWFTNTSPLKIQFYAIYVCSCTLCETSCITLDFSPRFDYLSDFLSPNYCSDLLILLLEDIMPNYSVRLDYVFLSEKNMSQIISFMSG